MVLLTYRQDGEKVRKDMRRAKRKTVCAYLDEKKLVDVVEAALDNNMMVADMKKKLVEENAPDRSGAEYCIISQGQKRGTLFLLFAYFLIF